MAGAFFATPSHRVLPNCYKITVPTPLWRINPVSSYKNRVEMAGSAPRLPPFWQGSHDMNDLRIGQKIATWGFSKSGRKMRSNIVHNSNFLPRQGRGNPCSSRPGVSAGEDALCRRPERSAQRSRRKTIVSSRASQHPSPPLYDVFQKSWVRAWRLGWPVFCRILCTCTFTVLRAKCMVDAMFWLSLPMSTRCRTSCSRSDS